jgi:hypothetical protein
MGLLEESVGVVVLAGLGCETNQWLCAAGWWFWYEQWLPQDYGTRYGYTF